MLSRINALILLLFFALSHTTFAIAEDLPYLDLGGDLFHLQPALQSNQALAQESVSLAQVMASDNWVDLNGKTTLRGAKAENWFRVNIPGNVPGNVPGNISGNALAGIKGSDRLTLEIANIMLDRVELYVLVNNQLKAQYTSGIHDPFSIRPIKHRKILFPLPALRGVSGNEDTRTVYFKTTQTGITRVPIRLWSRDSFIQYEKIETLFTGLFLGATLILGIYHLLLYFRIPKLYILAYAGSILAICCSNFLRWGYGLEYIWPNASVHTKPVLFIIMCLASAFFILFFIYFTGANRSNRYTKYYFYTACYSFVAIALAIPYAKLSALIPAIIFLTLLMQCSNIFLGHL